MSIISCIIDLIVIVFTAININTDKLNIATLLVRNKYNKPVQKDIHKEQSIK